MISVSTNLEPTFFWLCVFRTNHQFRLVFCTILAPLNWLGHGASMAADLDVVGCCRGVAGPHLWRNLKEVIPWQPFVLNSTLVSWYTAYISSEIIHYL